MLTLTYEALLKCLYELLKLTVILIQCFAPSIGDSLRRVYNVLCGGYQMNR